MNMIMADGYPSELKGAKLGRFTIKFIVRLIKKIKSSKNGKK